MSEYRSELERRLIERARDESRGWTNEDYDLVLSAAEAIGAARQLLRALDNFPGSVSLAVVMGKDNLRSKLEGGS